MTASDATPSPPPDSYGWSVALAGDTAVVGSPGDDHAAGLDAGSAYVYVRSAGTWTEQAKLIASDAAPDSLFGYSVAIFGDTIVAGAPRADHSSRQNAGATYVFFRTGSVWSEQAKLVADDAAINDALGDAVDIDGDTVVAGSASNPVPFGRSGAAYVFQRTGVTWAQQAKLTADTYRLGKSVSIQHDTIVTGAPFDTHAGAMTNAGAVNVFVRNGTTWTEQARLQANDAELEDEFGRSVSVFGDTLVVGAPDENANRGSVYVFERAGSTWTERDKLYPHDPSLSADFGNSVSLSATSVCVGSPIAHFGGQFGCGVAYLFERSSLGWREVGKIVADDFTASSRFATSASSDAGRILLGAPSAPSNGAAYVFELVPSITSCFADGSLPTPCPCAPPHFVPAPSGSPNAGCANSFDLSGAKLIAGGRVSPETLAFIADIGPSYTGFALMVKSETVSSIGFANGDGVRCLDGAMVRFGAHNAGAFGAAIGTWSYPNATQTGAVSLATAQTPGQTAYYQLLYRNALADFCSPGTTNWTNVVQVDW